MCCYILCISSENREEFINHNFPLAIQDEEQLCETEPDDSSFDLDKTENRLVSIGGDCGSEHQEDLLEGDLGLGTAPALAKEA